MNKYLIKLAGKLPSHVKHWVRERLKVDIPTHVDLFKAPGMDTHPAYIAGVKPMKERLSRSLKNSSKTARILSRMEKVVGKHEKSEYSRGDAIIERVLSAKVKK